MKQYIMHVWKLCNCKFNENCKLEIENYFQLRVGVEGGILEDNLYKKGEHE